MGCTTSKKVIYSEEPKGNSEGDPIATARPMSLSHTIPHLSLPAQQCDMHTSNDTAAQDDGSFPSSPPAYHSIYASELQSFQSSLLIFESHVLDGFKFDEFLKLRGAWRESCQQADNVPDLVCALRQLEQGMRWTSVLNEWRDVRDLWLSICEHIITESYEDVQYARVMLIWFEQYTGMQAFTSEWTKCAKSNWLLQLLRR